VSDDWRWYPNQPHHEKYDFALHAQMVQVTPPAVEPVSLSLAKAYAVIEHSQDDVLIQQEITAARLQVENWIKRPLITQTWDLWMNRLPYHISLRYPPVQSVSFVNYTDTEGNIDTVDPSTYQTDFTSEPARIWPAYDEFWPGDVRPYMNAVQVRFVCGYGDDGSTVPAPAIKAILELVALRYKNREPGSIGPDQDKIEAQIRARVKTLSWGGNR
jgi:uncharacterized phiE125 gp8 family phage protein